MEHQCLEETIITKKQADENSTVAVFDGMGGEFGGEIASYFAAKTFTEYIHIGGWNREDVNTLIQDMNEAVCKVEREQKIKQMGTTYVGAFFQEQDVIIANLGDSPAYRYKNGNLEKLTYAHTNEELLRSLGMVNSKPGLTQFLGIMEEGFIIEPFITSIPMQEGDVYLLCSDGLTDMVTEERIVVIINENVILKDAAEQLLQEALKNGGRDNITIMICRINAK